MIIQSKLPESEQSIFAIMSKMANDYQAINLSQGFPDFPVAAEIIEQVAKAMVDGHNQYAPMPGLPALRNQLAQVIKSTYGHIVDPDTDITITTGATEALFASIQALIQTGDEAIVFDPAYDSYDPAIRLAGGNPVHLSLNPEDYSIDFDQLSKAINSKTKLLIINSPHNPTGSILSEEAMLKLEKIVCEHDLFLISDEVYERIIFDGKIHQSALRFPELAKRSVVVFSFGKTFHATGWKTGYTVAPAALTNEIRKIHQYITFSVNTPVQHALAEYLKDPSHYENLGAFYQKKRDYFAERIASSRFKVLPCYGTYFQLLSFKEISDRPEAEMAEWLTKTHGVASIPSSPFYQQKENHQVLRFCFAKSEETLDKAAEILCKI